VEFLGANTEQFLAQAPPQVFHGEMGFNELGLRLMDGPDVVYTGFAIIYPVGAEPYAAWLMRNGGPPHFEAPAPTVRGLFTLDRVEAVLIRVDGSPIVVQESTTTDPVGDATQSAAQEAGTTPAPVAETAEQVETRELDPDERLVWDASVVDQVTALLVDDAGRLQDADPDVVATINELARETYAGIEMPAGIAQEFERAGVPEAVRKIALHAWFGDELVQHMLPPRTTDDITAFVPDVVRMLVGDLIVTRAGDEALSPVPNDFRSQLQQFHEQVAEAESRLAQLPSETRLRALGTAVRAMQDLRRYVGRLEFADESFTRLLRQMAGEGFLVPGLRLVADAARMSWPDGVPPATNREVLPEAVQQAVATVRSLLDAWIATTPRPQPRMRLRGGAPGENLFRRLAGHFSRHRNEGEGASNRWRRMGQRFNRLRRGESVVEAGPSEPVTSRSTGAQSPE